MVDEAVEAFDGKVLEFEWDASAPRIDDCRKRLSEQSDETN